jgi:hypothetical protein
MTVRTFDVAGPITLQARVGRGSIQVWAEDGLAHASVRLTPHHKDSDIAERFVVELRGATLLVTAPREGGIFDLPLFGNRGRDAIDVLVTVPTGTAVTVSTVSAGVVLRGSVGDADLASGSADIGADHIGGDLRLRHARGTCRIVQVDGSVTFRSGAGDARFGRIDGGLDARCGSGELVVRSVGGPVRSRVGSGTFTLDAAHGDVDLASGSGPVSIGLPQGQLARVDLHTGSGRVTSDLPIEPTPTSDGRPITIRARTGSGDIRLFRAA